MDVLRHLVALLAPSARLKAAVSSSRGFYEDSAQTSFAWLHTTLLHIVGAAAVAVVGTHTPHRAAAD